MAEIGFRVRMCIDGIMPERTLVRLRRAGICLFDVKKSKKTRILFTINEKEVEKVFAIYPNVCYNNKGYGAYTATLLGEVGVGKAVALAKKRVGLVVGGLLFCLATAFSNTLVLGVDVVGTRAYTRDVKQVLAEYGVKPFSHYPVSKTDEICNRLLQLNGVEYCLVQKVGMRVRVELRLANFDKPSFVQGDMTASRSGEILSLTVLRGTPLKGVGDKVNVGEGLVGGYFQTENGVQTTVAPMARVQMACSYQSVVQAEDEQQAFATAYLQLQLGENDRIERTQIAPTEGGFVVCIAYTVIQTVNF